MTPFYLSSTEVKLHDINLAMSQRINLYAASEGWLPAYVHNIIRGFLALLYAVAMWKLIRKTVQSNNVILSYSRTVIKWLKAFTLINGSLGIALMVCLIVIAIPAEIRSFVLHAVLSTALVIPTFYLFFKPEILYGLPQPILSLVSRPEVEEAVMPLVKEIPAFVYQYKNQVHRYLLESQDYCNSDFSMVDLARATSIPKHHLQLLIYRIEGMKFTEFINDFRIEHLKLLIRSGSMINKTLEGLAIESGFGSKATFIRSIKRVSGKTPKEFFNLGKSALDKEMIPK